MANSIMDNKEISFKEIYKTLSSIDVSSFTEKKNNLTYLSWSHAWNQVASRYKIEWQLHEFEHIENDVVIKRPYCFDPVLGYLVKTSIKIEEFVLSETLFVMDGANNAQKHIQYTYEVDEWKDKRKTGNKITKTVEAATMFDINTAIKRCLTKNLALFGLGIYIYAGEDLPLTTVTETDEEIMAKVTDKINGCKTEEELLAYWPVIPAKFQKSEQIVSVFVKKRTTFKKQ
jgi:hypothetical protein